MNDIKPKLSNPLNYTVTFTVKDDGTWSFSDGSVNAVWTGTFNGPITLKKIK